VSPRVGIVDDHAEMRLALRTILESHGVEVVGEAADGAGAISLVESAPLDVVLMDVRMPGTDGVVATGLLAAHSPDVRVLILTTFNDDDALYGALAAGAAGFLLKNSAPEDVVAAVRRVAAGDSVLDPTIAGRVFERFVTARGPNVGAYAHAAMFERLTEREKDVMTLMARGMTNAEIARHLAIGEATAKTHVARVLAKLEVRDRVQAVIRVYESGYASRLV
jgi:DNA-binding NarL/FixJ family response regulator